MKKMVTLLTILTLTIIGCLSGCNEQTNKTSNPMIINSFQVAPALIEIGYTANISWEVSGATNLNIDNNIGTVSLKGTRIIQPTQTTTYTLSASNATHTIYATTQIIVEGTIPIDNIPDISFIMDNANHRLTVTRVSATNIPWSDLVVTGQVGYQIHSLSSYVTAGDYISDCYGTITISYRGISLLGTWTFTSSPTETPDVAFIMDNANRKLIVTMVSATNIPWSDIVITPTSGLILHNSDTYVRAGDYISNCYGTVSLSYKGISLLGTWTFT